MSTLTRLLQLMQEHPDATDDELLQLAQQPAASAPSAPSALARAWEWANTPLADVDFGDSTLGRLGEGLVEGLSSPVGLGLTLAAPVAGLARSAGLMGASRALQAADYGLNAALGVEGLANVGRGMEQGDWGQALAGGLQAGGAGLGLKLAKQAYGSLPGRAFQGEMAGEAGRVQTGDWADVALGGARQGGFTARPDRGDLFGTPHSVVSLPGAERVIPAGEATPDAIRRFADEFAPYLTRDPRATVGGWVTDGTGGSGRYQAGDLVLNLGRLVDDPDYARVLAGTLGEEGAFNLAPGLDDNARFLAAAPVAPRLSAAWRARSLDDQLALAGSAPLALEHRTHQGALSTLDPRFYGRGYRGAEAARKAAYPRHFVPRSYATEAGGAVEPAIARFPHTYQTTVPSGLVYNASEDPLGLWARATQAVTRAGTPGDQRLKVTLVEKLARDAGYTGIQFPGTGKVRDAGQASVALFDPWSVTPAQRQADQLIARHGARTGATALSVAAPAAALAIPDNPDSELDDWARIGLMAAGAGGVGAVLGGGLTKSLAAEIAGIVKSFGRHEGKGWTEARRRLAERFGEEQAATLIRRAQATDIPSRPSEPEWAARFAEAGVDLAKRKPLKDLFTVRGDKSLQLKPAGLRRLDMLYAYGQTLKGSWDDRAQMDALFGDDAAVNLAADMFGTFSPGTLLEANVVNMVHGFTGARAGKSAQEIFDTVPIKSRFGADNIVPNIERTLQGAPLGGRKVANMAGGVRGQKTSVPVDLHLLRALGALEEKSPTGVLHDRIATAVGEAAARHGVSAFDYMATIWSAMRKITGDDEGGGVAQMLARVGFADDTGTALTHIQPSLFTGNAIERVPGVPTIPIQELRHRFFPGTRPVEAAADLVTRDLTEAPLLPGLQTHFTPTTGEPKAKALTTRLADPIDLGREERMRRLLQMAIAAGG